MECPQGVSTSFCSCYSLCVVLSFIIWKWKWFSWLLCWMCLVLFLGDCICDVNDLNVIVSVKTPNTWLTNFCTPAFFAAVHHKWPLIPSRECPCPDSICHAQPHLHSMLLRIDGSRCPNFISVVFLALGPKTLAHWYVLWYVMIYRRGRVILALWDALTNCAGLYPAIHYWILWGLIQWYSLRPDH